MLGQFVFDGKRLATLVAQFVLGLVMHSGHVMCQMKGGVRGKAAKFAQVKLCFGVVLRAKVLPQ